MNLNCIFLIISFTIFFNFALCEEFIEVDESYEVSADLKDKVEVLIKRKAKECKIKTAYGDHMQVKVVGSFINGTEFFSNLDKEETFSFELGGDQVLEGWDEGLREMCEGEVRLLTIKKEDEEEEEEKEKGSLPDLPLSMPHSPGTLVFEVELKSVTKEIAPEDIFNQIDSDKDQLLSQDEVSSYIKSQEEETTKLADNEHNNLVADIFNNEDEDRDGFISKKEFYQSQHDEL